MELSKYYKNPDYFNDKGYVSKYYGKTYFDGYGYNYYNGNYGYYEYSRPPVTDTGPQWLVGTFFLFLIVFVVLLIIFIISYYYILTYG